MAKARMLEAIKARPPFQVLVMQANDRLSRRDGHEALSELVAIARAGVQVWFYSDGTRFEHGTFASNTLGFLKAEFAAEFRRAIAAKTREAMQRKARQGYVTGGRVFGYDNVRVNSHTERRVNEAEAATVRRIYELYAAGHGLPTIAHTLNADGAPCPRPQQQRVSRWCGASVREILRRPLYRGEIVWGKARERDADWAVNAQRRPEDEWLRVPALHLRIVPERLAEAVDARFTDQRERALRLSDGRLLGRPPGEGSPYLLTGLLTCGVCGGGMEVLSSQGAERRVFHYRCYVARRKGAACCTNKQSADMALTDAAILATVQDTLLHPAVVAKALAHAQRVILRERSGGERGEVAADLTETEKAIRRLTAAVAGGNGELPELVGALRAAEARRQELRARLAALRAPKPDVDPPALRRQLEDYLTDWQGLLRGHVYQPQQVLRRLVVGRLVMTPEGAGRGAYYRFSGTGTVRPLLAGTVRMLVSPTGFEPVFRP